MSYFNMEWGKQFNPHFWKVGLSILAALAVYTNVDVIPREQQTWDLLDYYHQKKAADMRVILNEKLFWLKKARGDSVSYKRLIETAISLVEEDFDGTEQAKSNYRIAINDAERALAIAKHKQLLEIIIIQAYEEASSKKPNGIILENPDLV